MKPERWARIEQLCHEALEREPGARQAFLEAACAGDAALQAEVESLLAEYPNADAFLAVPARLAWRPPAGETLGPGTRLGPYTITGLLGVGGMAEVYRGRDTRLGRTVAIKILPPAVADDPERRRRFETEARAVSALNHPHICVLYDVGRDVPTDESGMPGAVGRSGPVDFLVMEHLEGHTLAHHLREGALPLDAALDLGVQVAEALAAAHRQGIVHRDLKPANVMLTPSGARLQAKLLDFGLAKPSAEAQPAAHVIGWTPAAESEGPATSPGVLMGTVPYMAPEQLEGKEADARTDLFAFGCLLFEMLTGRRAFAGETEAALIAAIRTSEPPPVSALQPLASPTLDQLVRTCLAKDPAARRQSAEEVAEELRALAQRMEAAGSREAAAPRRRLALSAAVVLGVLVAAGIVAVVLGRLVQRPSSPARFALAMPARTVLSHRATQLLATSPDGRGVVYEGLQDGEVRLCWSDTLGGGSWPLAGTEKAQNPFLSPDGRWIGFWRDRQILKLPLRDGHVLDGSPVTAITPARAVGGVRGATWNDDGIVVYGGDAGGLWSVPASGGSPTSLASPDAGTYGGSYRWPAFLPGGRSVLFTIMDPSSRVERSALAVLSLDTHHVTRVLEGGVYGRYLAGGYLVFLRDRRVFAASFDSATLKVSGPEVPVVEDVYLREASNNAGFEVSANGTLVYAPFMLEPERNTLAWVDRQGRLDAAVPDRRPYMPDTVSLSPNGRKLAVAIRGDRYVNIWTYDLAERRWQQMKVDADCDAPVWSPSGDQLAFESNLEGEFNVYVMATDGRGAPVRLTRSGNRQWACSWSPDARYLAYEEDLRLSGGPSINTYLLPLDGRAKAWRYGPDGRDLTLPAFSPDGRWLAYQAQESWQFEVYVASATQADVDRQRVSAHGGFAPAWSSDGRELFYVEKLQDTRILSRRVLSSAPLRLAEPRVVFALPFALANPYYFTGRGFAVSPDGGRVLVVQRDERARKEINALNVITNWASEVRAKLRPRR